MRSAGWFGNSRGVYIRIIKMANVAGDGLGVYKQAF